MITLRVTCILSHSAGDINTTDTLSQPPASLAAAISSPLFCSMVRGNPRILEILPSSI